ncbi:hypothetical protein GIB67_012151 [Kingdonia uniflora]|uniref:Uncharacterized protein n=1 Tax=Kingdonia uniflora TaxID=39325 RepID=A0A7J7N9V0_9MAGN|nr:hypothetical protein GIB67_012151 [Kingdonia uniflora]
MYGACWAHWDFIYWGSFVRFNSSPFEFDIGKGGVWRERCLDIPTCHHGIDSRHNANHDDDSSRSGDRDDSGYSRNPDDGNAATGATPCVPPRPQRPPVPLQIPRYFGQGIPQRQWTSGQRFLAESKQWDNAKQRGSGDRYGFHDRRGRGRNYTPNNFGTRSRTNNYQPNQGIRATKYEQQPQYGTQYGYQGNLESQVVNPIIFAFQDLNSDVKINVPNFDGKLDANGFINWLNRGRKQSVDDYTSDFYMLSSHVVLSESEAQRVSRFCLGLTKRIQDEILFSPQPLSEIVEMARRVEAKLKPSGYPVGTVAELLDVPKLLVEGTMETQKLSPKTTYVAYFIYKLRAGAKGFDQTPVHVLISFIEIKGCQKSRSVYLDTNNAVWSRKRKDGWLEIEMGEFFNDAGEDGAINMILKDMNRGDSKSGLIIQGIELRPKHASTPETLIAKKAYMIKATDLKYLDAENPKCWQYITDPRFGKVAQLLDVPKRRASGTKVTAAMETRELSPKTTYEAYFVYKLNREAEGFKQMPAKALISFIGMEDSERSTSVYLNPNSQVPPQIREDGWLEIKMGEFFNSEGEDGVVHMILKEIKRRDSKSGLVIQGIELRPKSV